MNAVRPLEYAVDDSRAVTRSFLRQPDGDEVPDGRERRPRGRVVTQASAEYGAARAPLGFNNIAAAMFGDDATGTERVGNVRGKQIAPMRVPPE